MNHSIAIALEGSAIQVRLLRVRAAARGRRSHREAVQFRIFAGLLAEPVHGAPSYAAPWPLGRVDGLGAAA